MSSTLRFLAGLILISSTASAQTTIPAPKKAQPVPPPALPAFVDVVSFAVRYEGEDHKLTATVAPTALRIDEPEDGYSVIYDPQTEHYTGLETRNYTYWEFSWPEVRAAVENSKRYEAHLQDLSNQGLSPDDSPASATNAPSDTPATTTVSGSGPGDQYGYVWRPTENKKRIAGYDCIGWTGDTVSGEHVDAWCYAAPLPKVQDTIAQLRTINEPMSLVPVRDVAPDFIFPVYDSLTKAGVTPLLITWGDEQQPNRFELLKVETRPAKPALFAVPKLYMKTTLVTLDGIIDQPK